jgi:lincosamide and streptogramin A transport system ATP-binding/permease protein
MALINVQNLTFAHEGSYDPIFVNVSFQIDTDWKLGFTGRNGRGKTTFLHLLMGKYEYGGTITSSVSFDYFPFPVADEDALTLEVAQSVVPQAETWQILRELTQLDVAEDALYRPFSTLSNGERTKVLIAALFLKEDHFLLIDEPTNHLDMAAREVVSNYLRGKKGFILVSHDRAFLDNCIDHILSINRTNIEVQKGNFSSWWWNKEKRDEREMAENERLRKEIRRLSEAARRTGEWSDMVERSKIGAYDKGYVGHKAAKMMKRSKSIERRQQKAIEERSGLLKDIETAESLKIRQVPYHKSRLAELDKVSIVYDGRAVCRDVSFAIERGDRIALMGPNGSGKSSLLKLLVGEAVPHTGEVRRGSGLVVSYVPQDASGLRGNLTEYARRHGIDETLFKAILRKLDFARVQFEKDMSSYSAGQKKKVLIARSLCEEAHLHVWDEPLNYIDVISRMQIEELLLEYQPTMLFVEHDRTFCERMATKTVELPG